LRPQEVFGNELADELRARVFVGVVLIRSANAGDEERTKYLRSGAVDGCIGKEGSNRDLALAVEDHFVRKSLGYMW
jgi:hypothetical protein